MPGWEESRALKTAAKRAAYAKFGVDISGLVPESRKNVTAVPRECGKLSDAELQITETPATELVARLAAGKISAVAVVTAFGKRALIADQVVNCLTEVFLDRAIADAKELDEYLAKHGKPKGPLHGLPISLKEQFSIKGIDTCMGYSAWVGKPAEKDSVLVTALKRAGAVLYVRTNVPQTLMFGESDNPVFGRTMNPFNRDLTCGGSSGGEGALVAMRGSPLGVGTDIGGSVRIPSAFNGIYGLKPSFHRLPYGGAANSLLGLESIVSALGPMSTDFCALELFCSAVLEQKPWEMEVKCLPIPWRREETVFGRKPVFGYYIGNELFDRISPSIERAIKDTVARLRARGYEVKELQMLHANESGELNLQIFNADGGQDILRDAGTDPIHPGAQFMVDYGRKLGRGDGQGLTSYEMWQVNRRKDEVQEIWRAYLEQQGVDAIVCPVAPWPSHPHGKGTTGVYTGIFNLLNYSAGVVPHSTVRPDDVFPANHKGRSKMEDTLVRRWDPNAWKDAPVCVQVVTGRLQEEKCLAAMRIVKEAIDAPTVRL